MRSDIPDRTFEFACRTVKGQVLNEKPGVSRTLANQLLRSGTSIGANVKEGQAYQSEADLIGKYCIAGNEARETRYWLRLLAASDLLPKNRLGKLTSECNEQIAILTAIIKRMREKQP
ncbi:MAG: four helix bundle protein [Gammaproteobacteria bacterium]|nr:four helix bundle protein [Gammaproteobacteria bacterium]